MSGACSTHGKIRNAFKILVGKSEGKIPLGRHTRRLDNLQMDLKEIGSEDVDWTHLEHNMDQYGDLVYITMNLRLP
jgi:hypothetical protein